MSGVRLEEGHFLKDFIYLFLEGKREKEGNINVWLPLACPLLGTWPTTQACALDWEWFTGLHSIH